MSARRKTSPLPKQIDTLLGADADFLYRLTDGIEVHGPYLFEALDVKDRARRIDGVLMPQREDEGIWVIESQAQPDPLEEILEMLGELTPLEETEPTRSWLRKVRRLAVRKAAKKAAGAKSV